MKYLKQMQLESKELEVFEVTHLLSGFLADLGIAANVEKFDHFFNIYISGYAEDSGRKKIPVSKLLNYFKSLGISEDAVIQKTKFGYTIEMLNDPASEKLMESFEEDEDEGEQCCICKKTFYGWGNNPWPVSKNPGDRCCDDCNAKYVIPMRIAELSKNKNKTEATDKKSAIEHAASNIVLDNKFIWLFNVLDKEGQDIEEGIEYLQDAIDILIKRNNQAGFLVAFPYIDPKPEDPSIDLVFADNPGPVVIYNGEEATVSKNSISRPSVEQKPKKEATINERSNTNAVIEVDPKALYLLSNVKGKSIEGYKAFVKKNGNDKYGIFAQKEPYDKDPILLGYASSKQLEPYLLKSDENHIKEALKAIDFIYKFFEAHSDMFEEDVAEKILKYCNILEIAAKKIDAIANSAVKESTKIENIAELQTSILYDMISDYFPDDDLPDVVLDSFEELAKEYIEDNYSYIDILRMIENNYHEQLFDLASEVYEAVLEHFNLEESHKLNEALGDDWDVRVSDSNKPKEPLKPLPTIRSDEYEHINIPLGFNLTEEEAGIIDAVIGQSSDGMWEDSSSKKNEIFWTAINAPSAGDNELTFIFPKMFKRNYDFNVFDFYQHFPRNSVLNYVAYKIGKLVKAYKEDWQEDYVKTGTIQYLNYKPNNAREYVEPTEQACTDLAKKLRQASKEGSDN